MKKYNRSFWLILTILFLSASPALSQGPWGDSMKKIKTPGPEWGKDINASGTEGEFFVKGKRKAVNVSLKIFTEVPLSIPIFLGQVRKGMQEDSKYDGAFMGNLKSQTLGNKQWSSFSIKMNPEIRQEVWGRKLNSDTALLVLFTAVGTYYDQYHPSFVSILAQSAD